MDSSDSVFDISENIMLNNQIEKNTHSISKESQLTITKQQRQIHYIYKEYASIVKNPIEGVYSVVSAFSPLVWFGIIIVRTGVFCGGIFRFTINIPESFPDSDIVPEVHFEDNIFHPLICSKTDRIDLSRSFPSGWQRDRNHVYQILTAIQAIFFSCHCDPASAANPEASILLKENKRKFIELAHDTVRISRTQVYAIPNEDDRNAIRFYPWNDLEMEPFRLYLLSKGDVSSNIPISSTSTLMESSSSSAATSGSSSLSIAPTLAWLFRKLLASKPKAGFSWVDPKRSRYMCDNQLYV